MPRPPLSCFFPRLLLAGILFLLLLSLGGCGTFDGMFDRVTFGEEEQPKAETPEALLAEGMEAFNTGEYKRAQRSFDVILEKHPFSAQAMLAELKAADAYYYEGSYLEAKALYQEFEERHPTNEAMAYVMFQIGMCDFARTDRIDRDITASQDAIKSFSRLLRTFPDSPYSKEARARIATSHDFLVNHEYLVAVFYTRTKKYKQAEHRLKYILHMYPNSNLAPKAAALLQRLQEGNPPVMGLDKWLPDWQFWRQDDPENEEDTAKKEPVSSSVLQNPAERDI